MEIGIIAANSLRLSPYAFFYSGIMDELGMDYEFVVPERNSAFSETEKSNERVRSIPWDNGKHSFLNYCLYSGKVKRICNELYDCIIVLTSTNAVFFAPWITRKFRKKYIIDVRDFTYENNYLFRKIENIVFNNSALNVISSPKFETFLPKGDYYVTHNITTPTEVSPEKFKKNTQHIIIGYVGSVGYAKQCKKLLELVNADSRFSFFFFGSGPDESELVNYVADRQMDKERIKFFGAYTSEQKGEIVQKIDLLFNCYGNGNRLLECALSNKLYDGLYYHKPILNSPSTFMDEIGGKLSFVIDFNKIDNLDELWHWYQDLDKDEIDEFASNLYKELVEQSLETKERIKKQIRHWQQDNLAECD